MKLRLASRIVLFFVLLVAVLLGAVGALSYRSGSESLRAAVISGMLSKAVEKEAALNTWIEKGMDDIGRIARHKDVVQHAAGLVVAAPRSSEARVAYKVLLEELEPYVSSPRSDFTELFVMDAESGKVLVSTNPVEEGKSKLGHTYFDNGKVDVYLQLPYLSVDSKVPLMTVGIPLRATNGRVVAVLAAQLDLGQMSTIALRRSGLYETEDSYLINAEGFLVTQPRLIREPEVLRRRIDTEAARALVAGDNGVTLAPDYRGVPVISVYRWISSLRLGLLVEIDQAEALAPVRAFGQSLVLISTLALLVTTVLAFFLARTITRPLVTLQEKVRRFGEGNIEGDFLNFQGDEVSVLAHEFGRMSARVVERTTELAQANEALHLENSRRKRAEETAAEKTILLSNVINASPDFIIVKDKDLRTRLCNQAVGRAIGKEPEELYGKTDIENGWPHEQVKGNASKSIRGFEADDLEALAGNTVHNPADPANVGNEVCYFDTLKVPLHDAAGAIIGMLGVARDVTARKRAEEALERANRSLQIAAAVIENASEGVMVIDAKLQIESVNPAFEQITGY
ncbi:MAG: PAS domain-containing protein, partial [Betaproteobacteria bacterium]